MNNVSINSKEVDDLLMALDSVFKNEILFNALKKGAKYIQKEAQSNLSSLPYNINSKQISGINVRGDKQMTEVNVTINKHPLNHLFEAGTAERYVTKRNGIELKKPAFTGRMKDNNFFGAVIQNAGAIENEIYSGIIEQLNKIG